jgi:O-antigen ligase
VVLWLLFAALYGVGFLSSDNTDEAIQSIVVKLTVFLYPPVLASIRFPELRTKRILQSLLSGLVLVGVFMLLRALYYHVNGNTGRWTYQSLTEDIMHPSYISLLYVVGIMICFHGILLRAVPKNKKAIAVTLILFFTVMVFLLSSKTGLISLVVAFLFYIGYAVVRFRRYYVAGAALVALIIAFFVSLNVFPAMEARLKAMLEVISSDKPIDPANGESNSVRLLIWSADLELIAEHPLTGVGTGDVQDALMQKYAEKGMTGAYEKKLNAHSQYYQTGIALGVPGMIILIGILFAAFVWSVRRRYGFAALLTLLIAFNFLPESMLQVQAGTMFFGFFFSFILFAADPAVISPDR